MIQETDEVLDRFDTAVADLVEQRFEAASDAEILEVIRSVVLDFEPTVGPVWSMMDW